MTKKLHVGMRNGANGNIIYRYDGADAYSDSAMLTVLGAYSNRPVESQEPKALAFARDVVNAYNSHDEMLEALKAADALIDNLLMSDCLNWLASGLDIAALTTVPAKIKLAIVNAKNVS